MSTAKPSLAPCSARYAGEPLRCCPKWKSKPMAAPPMPKRPARICPMKSSAEVLARPASNVMTTAPSSPVAASRRNLSRSLESWNSVSCGLKKSRGCGAKVKAAALRPSFLARLSAAPMTARWPRCTPSKLPTATTAPCSGPMSPSCARHGKLFAGWPGLFIE